jgi:outer membrane receptor protein involved in Fe transport
MTRRILVGIAIVGLLLCFSLPATAQTTTGRILGQVTGLDGVAMPGVTITVNSPAIMGGSRTAVTGETGAYRIAALPPGVYNVSAELPGYQSQTIEGVSVALGGTGTADFALQPQFSDEMVVTSESPLLDTTSSSVPSTYSADFLKDLPTQRNFYDIIAVSPNVSLATEDTSRMVAGGSNVQSNAWFIDGIETAAPETGTSWVGVNPDAIQEVQVMGIGAPAEYGNMLGAAFNVVTKSGSNEVKGGVNAYWFDDSLVDSNINFDSEFPEYVQNEFWDVAATLGGPIAKDRLWFFAAYEYWRDNHAFPGSDPEINPTWYQDRYDVKLSWRIDNSNLIDGKGYFSKWGYPDPSSPYTTPSASAGEIGEDTMWGLSYQSIFSDRTFMEVRYTGWSTWDDYLSQTGSTEAAYIDYSPPGGGPTLYSGGVWYPWTYDTSVDQVSVAVSTFADDFIKGDHDFKFGIQAGRGDNVGKNFTSANGSYYYHYYSPEYEYYGEIYGGDYYYKVDGLPYFYGAENTSIAAFVDDSWKISDRLTFNLGVRYDYHKGVIPSYDRLDANGDPTGVKVPGVDPVFTWNNFSPRIGFAYAAGAEQNTVIRGSFGVYYDGNVTGNWDSPAPFQPPQYYSTGESWDGPWEPQGVWWDPGDNTVQPDLKAPRTLQYSVGFETGIGENYSFGITGLYKDTKDLIGWQIMDDGVYEEVEWTDPFTGNTYTLLNPTVYPSLRKGNTPGFTIDPTADSYWQEYWAVIVEFNRRFADFWSMQASYTYSESTGLIAAFLSQWQSNPLYGQRWGSDPNSFLNANGQRLQGDRPHMFRVQANFQLPWNMNANTMVNLQSGRPYNRLSILPTETRPQAVVAPAGDPGRHPFQYQWDIGVGKTFDLGGNVGLQIDLQLFNVLNDTPTDWFETTTLAEGDVYIPNTWVKPRRLQLHVGIEF